MRLRDLRNLGPASERMLKAAGITTPRQLDRVGAAEAYRRVLAAGGHPSRNLLWSLEAALLDLDWRDLPRERKEALEREIGISPNERGQVVRPATRDDIARLQAIERDAGKRFGEIGLQAVEEEPAASEEDLRAYVDAGRAWVHDDRGDGPVGYILVSVVDGNTHIDQVSVVVAHDRCRIGRGLIDHASGAAVNWGYRTMTLTTFRDVPWNAPYYRTLGFEEVEVEHVGPELGVLMAREDRFGEPRVAMWRSTSAANANPSATS